MVHFVMTDHEDLQWPSNGQCSICVIIIKMCLLHVHMLEIVQLTHCIRLGSDRVCIPKALQHLTFGTLSNLVAVSFYNIVLKACSLS